MTRQWDRQSARKGTPIVCLMGPTASGKSSAAMALADHFPIEIVSVDSAQVYRGMDIGTAKPGAPDQARVAHHLIDLLDPAESYSAARFRTDALRAIADIRSRGKLPILVGGTMLYFKALRDGLDDLPAANFSLRAEIDAQAGREGWPALHRELTQVDAITAARLAPNDAQRIQRAVEVWRITGKPLSSFHSARAVAGPYRFVNIALEPSDRAALHSRIERRFDAMLAQGLVDEVRALRSRGDPELPLHPELPSMRCVGYRQAWSFLDASIDGSEMRAQAIAATRQLAKRQLTWLRAIDDRIVIDCLAPHVERRTLEIVEAVARGLRWSCADLP